jgi:hypothetical protein
MKMAVLRVVAPCSPVEVYRRFGDSKRLEGKQPLRVTTVSCITRLENVLQNALFAKSENDIKGTYG